MNKKLVTKSNELIQAGYRLSINEQRLILACLAQVDPRRELTPHQHFTVTAADFAEMYGLNPRGAFDELKKAVDNLYERSIHTYDGRYRDKFRWVDFRRYYDGEAKATISFTYWVAPYLCQLREQFTSYELKEIRGFKSPHTIRIYELIMQFKGEGRRLIAVDDLKRWLCLEDAYPRFTDLKRWVIDPSVAEINRDIPRLKLSLIVVRRKRIAVMLDFRFLVLKSLK